MWTAAFAKKGEVLIERIIVFDIDATLILSGGAGARALDRAFEEVTGAADAMEGVPFHGMTDCAIISEMAKRKLGARLSETNREEVRRLYAAYLEPELAASPGFEVMAGVPELLDTLAADSRVLLGLATGNFEETAMLKLERGGLAGYFRFGGYGTDSESRPELTRIAVERGRAIAGDGAGVTAPLVYLVGDTVFDIRCGNAAGARTVGVATGITSEAELLAEKPYAVLPDLADKNRFYEILELDGAPPG